MYHIYLWFSGEDRNRPLLSIVEDVPSSQMLSLKGFLFILPVVTETVEGKENHSKFSKVASPMVYLLDSNQNESRR